MKESVVSEQPDWCLRWADAQREIDRLRAALERIAAPDERGDVWEIARAALAGTAATGEAPRFGEGRLPDGSLPGAQRIAAPASDGLSLLREARHLLAEAMHADLHRETLPDEWHRRYRTLSDASPPAAVSERPFWEGSPHDRQRTLDERAANQPSAGQVKP